MSGFFDKMGSSLKRQLSLPEYRYLGGHPDKPAPSKAILERRGDDILAFISSNPNVEPFLTIPVKDIINVSLDKTVPRSLEKAAGVAIIGRVPTCGFGMLARGIEYKSSNAGTITLTIKYGLAEIDLLFGGENVSHKYEQFMALLK